MPTFVRIVPAATIVPAAKIVPLLLVVGLLSAACSSSGSGGSPKSTTPSTTSSSAGPSGTPSTSTSSAGGSAPSAATLKGIVVQQSDLPAGWTGKAPDPETAQDKDVDAQLAACVGTGSVGDKDEARKAQSDDFSQGQMQVSSDATSYKSESDVQAQVALLKNSKAQSCFSSLFKKEIAGSLPSAATVKGINIQLDTSGTGIANVVGSLNGKVTVATKGQTITVYLGAGFFTGKQLTGEVTFISIGTPVTSAFANPIVEAVAKRAANA